MKRKILYLTAILSLIYLMLLVLLTGCSTKNTGQTEETGAGTQTKNYQLVWQDEFNYTGLPDSNKWDYATEGNAAGWGNKESQFYTKADPDNAHVSNGKLYITARKEKVGGKEYTSARLYSKADWHYGKIEVRAKIPAGRGTWSAIWMMPGGWTFLDGNWPDVGEIDIMEHVAHDLGVVHASAHSKDYQWQKNTQRTDTIHIRNIHKTFHTYSLEWTPEVLIAYVDSIPFFEYENEGLGESKWPYDKPFHLLLNIAVGGAWGSSEGIDADAFPQSMEIDYVRIYQKEPTQI